MSEVKPVAVVTSGYIKQFYGVDEKFVHLEDYQRLRDQKKALLVRLYNAGYKAGHHDTVEGQYTDIFEVDMDSYHEDEVDEIIEGER